MQHLDGTTIKPLSAVLRQLQVQGPAVDALKAELYKSFGRYAQLHTALITVQQYNQLVRGVKHNLLGETNLRELGLDGTLLLSLDVSW